MPQGPPPIARKVYVPNVGTVEVAPGQSIQDAIAAAQSGPAPSMPLTMQEATGADPFKGVTGPELVKGMGKVGLDAAIFGTGLMGGGMPLLQRTALRMAATAPLGAARSAIDGGNPLMGAALEAGMSAGGDLGAEYIPKAAVGGALSIGGGLTRLSHEEIQRAMQAFTREAKRQQAKGAIRGGRAIPVGAHQRVQREIDKQGTMLELLENSSTAGIPPSQLRNLTDHLRKDDVGFPATYNRAITLDEARFVREQAARHGTGPYTVRQLGNIRRDLAHSPAAEAVVNSRVNKEFVPSDVKLQGQLDAARAEKLKDIQLAVAPELGPVNQRLSDLFTMRGTNQALRSGGTMLGDIGLLSMRGALGYALGKMAGVDPSISTALGWLLLSPSNISRAGFTLGRAAEAAPHAFRGARVIADGQEEREKVQRRKPQ